MSPLAFRQPCPQLDPAAVPQGIDGTVDSALARARDGDPAGFASLLRLQQARVFGVALRIVGDRGEAEEIAQDAFLQLHGALGQIADGAHLRHWLLRAVAHRAIDRLRARRRQVPLVGHSLLEALPGADDATGDPLLGRALTTLLGELPPAARAVLVLRFQEDLDPSGIASALDMPVNTVKSHLRRSLDWLRDRWPEPAP